MPVSTEVLNEDIKDMKSEIHGIDTRLAALAAEFHFAKWLLGLSLALTLSGISFGIWWGGNINAKVDGLEKRFDKIDNRFDRLESSVDGLEKRFDRLETSVAKILEQTKPAAKPQ